MHSWASSDFFKKIKVLPWSIPRKHWDSGTHLSEFFLCFFLAPVASNLLETYISNKLSPFSALAQLLWQPGFTCSLPSFPILMFWTVQTLAWLTENTHFWLSISLLWIINDFSNTNELIIFENQSSSLCVLTKQLGGGRFFHLQLGTCESFHAQFDVTNGKVSPPCASPFGGGNECKWARSYISEIHSLIVLHAVQAIKLI